MAANAMVLLEQGHVIQARRSLFAAVVEAAVPVEFEADGAMILTVRRDTFQGLLAMIDAIQTLDPPADCSWNELSLLLRSKPDTDPFARGIRALLEVYETLVAPAQSYLVPTSVKF